ncbi:hypothetical protein LPJ81_007166, partial [Coemansia sp. IMI 209127]
EQEAAQTVTITTTQVSTVTSTVEVPTTTTIVSTITQDVTQTVTQTAANNMQQPDILTIMNQPSPNVMTVTVTKTEQPAMPQYMPYVQPAPYMFFIGQGGGDGQAFQRTYGQQAAADITSPAVYPKTLEDRLPVSSAPPAVDQLTTAMTIVPPTSEPAIAEMPTSEPSITEMPTSEPDKGTTSQVIVVQTIDTTSYVLATVGN